MLRKPVLIASLAAVPFIPLLTACGTPNQDAKTASSPNATPSSSVARSAPRQDPPATSAAPRDHVTPPEAYYAALVEQSFESQPSAAALTGQSVLFVNTAGAHLVKGYGRGQSFLLCQPAIDFPATALEPAAKAELLRLVQAHFDAAKVALTVVGEAPRTGDFTTINVGGTYASLGCPEDLNTLGIAPLDTRNRSATDIGFVFAERHKDLLGLAASIAHEAGHTFGLEHVQDKTDLMYAYAGDGVQAFKASRIQDSNRVQDEPAYMQAYVGAAAGASPWAASPSALDDLQLLTALGNLFGGGANGTSILNDVLYYAENSGDIFQSGGQNGLLNVLRGVFTGGGATGGSSTGTSGGTNWLGVLGSLFGNGSSTGNNNNSLLDALLAEVIARSFGSGSGSASNGLNFFDIIKLFQGSALTAEGRYAADALPADVQAQAGKLFGLRAGMGRAEALSLLHDKKRFIETHATGESRRYLLALVDAVATRWR